MIKNNLRHILRDQGMSLSELARETGLDYSRLHRFASMGGKNVRWDLLQGVCEALDVQPGDLLQHVPGELNMRFYRETPDGQLANDK